MLPLPTTADIRKELVSLYNDRCFRTGKYGKTVEIQNAHFIADKDSIIRAPNYDYAKREIKWYESQSLFVKDIPGDVPKIWQMCADKDGKINSNYGWCIWSDENGNQFRHCVDRLMDDHYTREACMIYNRPSMQVDCNANGMHDFMCTYSTQHFLNEVDENEYRLDYTVFQRSCDACFGYNNDVLWHRYVQQYLLEELRSRGLKVNDGVMYYNCGSLHVYERHFNLLNELALENIKE
jgi:thymidylate synthase